MMRRLLRRTHPVSCGALCLLLLTGFGQPATALPSAEASAPAPTVAAPASVPDASRAWSLPAPLTLDAFIEANGLAAARDAGQLLIVSSREEAVASGASAPHIIVSDGVSHARFDRADLPGSRAAGAREAARSSAPGSDVLIKVDGHDYEAVFGEAIELAAYPENEAGLTQALNAAAEQGKGVRLKAGASYRITTTLLVKDGVRFLDGNGATLVSDITTTNTSDADVIEIQAESQGITIGNLGIDLGNREGSTGISGNGIKDATIGGVWIKGVRHRGIEVTAQRGDVTNLRILDSRIEATPPPAKGEKTPEGVEVISVKAKHAGAKGYDKDNPFWDGHTRNDEIDAPLKNHSGTIIAGNTISGGYYGISLDYAQGAVVTGNVVTGNERNISVQNGSARNIIAGNHLSESKSAGVHIAYYSHDNQVHDNVIVSSRAEGEGILQAYTGSKRNSFTGNVISMVGEAAPMWALYAATDASGTVFSGNVVSAPASRAFVGIESVWDLKSVESGKREGQMCGPQQHCSYMDAEKDNKNAQRGPGEGPKTSYYGGRGPLRDVVVQGNVMLAGNERAPLFYVGADVSGGRKPYPAQITGNVENLTIAGNHIAGSGFPAESVPFEHTGTAHGLGPASISYADKSIGSMHASISDQPGTAGDDVLVLDHASDRVAGGGGNDTLYASVNATLPADVEHLRMISTTDGASATGNALGNTISGSAVADVIDGAAGDDALHGGQGADRLTGGAGKDRFVMDARLDGQADELSDFSRGEDSIVLHRLFFGELAGEGWFAANAGAATADTRVLQDGQRLLFDADGSGGRAQPVHFATLKAGVQLTVADFTQA